MRRVWAGKTQMQVAATLRSRVTDQLQAQRYRWYQALPTGDLVGRAGVDADAAVEVMAPVPYSTGTLLMIVISAVWLVITDPVLGALALLLFPVLIGLNIVYQRQVNQPATEAQDRLGEVSSVVHESFDGVLVVKALGAESQEVIRLSSKAAEPARRQDPRRPHAGHLRGRARCRTGPRQRAPDRGRRPPGGCRSGHAGRHHELRLPVHAPGVAAADHRLRARRHAPLAGGLGSGVRSSRH